MGQLVKKNMSMWDVAVQACGTADAVMAICAANDVAVSDAIAPGTVLDVPADAPVSAAQLKYLRERSIWVGTMGSDWAEPSVGMSVGMLLRPTMTAVVTSAEDPLGFGDSYSLKIVADPAQFVSVNGLESAWLDVNVARYLNIDDYVSGGSAGTAFVVAPTLMTDRFAKFQIPFADSTSGSMLVWDANPTPTKTFTYRDLSGNVAICCPLVCLTYDTNSVAAYLCPAIAVEVVSDADGVATVRLTRSVPGIGAAPDGIAVTGMTWDYTGTAGYADPADPSNTDKLLIDRVAGVYSVGVVASFDQSGTALPVARFSVVFEVL